MHQKWQPQMHPSVPSGTHPLAVTGMCTGLELQRPPATHAHRHVSCTPTEAHGQEHAWGICTGMLADCVTVTHRGTVALGVHTHIHTPPGTPSFPFLTPFPPFPSPLTSLGQSHPSSFRSKSASSQGGERCQCLLPTRTPPGRLCRPPPTSPHTASMGCTHFRRTGLHRDAAHEGDGSLQPPYRGAPQPPRHPHLAAVHLIGLWLPQSWAVSVAAKDGLGLSCVV